MPYKDKTKQKEYDREKYLSKKDNPFYILAERDRNRKRYVNFPERQLFNCAKGRAKRTNKDFNLEQSDIIIPKICPVLGIEIKSAIGLKKNNDYSPSVDRIDNSLGYVKGNIVVISWRANRLKGNATFLELEKIYKYYKNICQS